MENTNVKPINTEYNGYFFRSRLEARWAVYFDSLGIKYFYEHEGFELPSGKKYLPDFYLPDHEFFCEVKPFDQNDERWEELVLHTGKGLVLLAGEPSVSQQLIFIDESRQHCPKCSGFLMEECEDKSINHYPKRTNRIEGSLIPKDKKYFPFFYVDFPYDKGDEYDKAATAAKSKRFEFIS